MEIKCACGCGAILTDRDNRNRPRRYISGHNALGRFSPYRVHVLCEWCGIYIEKLESSIKNYNHTFCSRHCRAKYNGNKLKNDWDYRERQRTLIKRLGNKPPQYKGELHWNWLGGKPKVNRGSDYNYIQWRRDVLAKDNFICGICGTRGGKLSAHHIVPWSKCEALRYEVSNGKCLCYKCHMKLHKLNKKCDKLET